MPLYLVDDILLKQKQTNDFYQSEYSRREDSFFWYWCCSRKSLANRAKALLPKVRFLRDMGVFCGQNTYFCFVNNQTEGDPVYDSIRFEIDNDYSTFTLAFHPEFIDIYSSRLPKENRNIKINHVLTPKAPWSQLKQLIRNSTDFKLILKSLCSGPNSFTALERLHLIRLKSNHKDLIQISKDYYLQEFYQKYLDAVRDI